MVWLFPLAGRLVSSASLMANSPIFWVVRWPYFDWQGDSSIGKKSWPLASWQQALGCHMEHCLEGEFILQPCSFRWAGGSAGLSDRLAERPRELTLSLRSPYSASSLFSLPLSVSCCPSGLSFART